MIRLLSLSLAAVLFLAAGNPSGEPPAGVPVPQGVPKAATVEINLLKAPGIDEAGSNWEINYEFSIAGEATLWEAGKQGKFSGGSKERVGDLIKQGVVKTIFRSQEDRKVVLRIPLSPEIQKRLRDQPREFIKITPGQMTPEDLKLSREQESKSQTFLLRSVINVYDAKLKKTLLIPASFTWTFARYPEARFEIKVEINNDGSYSVSKSLPTQPRSR